MFPRRQIWFQEWKTLQVHEYQHKYTLVTVSFMKVDMEEEKKNKSCIAKKWQVMWFRKHVMSMC